MLSCRLTSGPLWLGIYLFLWWFLLALFGLFVLHWRYELPCQDKLPEFHYTPIVGCIRVLWFVFHPLGLGLDKALCGWNSVMSHENQQVLEDLLTLLNNEFRKEAPLTITQGKIHDYLGMVMKGASATRAANHPFNVNPDCNKLGKKKHHSFITSQQSCCT